MVLTENIGGIVMVRRFSIMVVMVLIAAACVCVLGSGEVHAAADLKLKTVDVDFDTDIHDNGMMVTVFREDGCEETILDAVSDDIKIVKTEVHFRGEELYLYAMGVGETTVTVTGSAGTVIPVNVKVGVYAMEKTLKCWSDVFDLNYGDPKVTVSSIPGTRVKLKIGSHKYKDVITPTSDEDATTRKKITMKMMYDVKTKVTATFSRDGAKVVKTFKFSSFTIPSEAEVSGKTFKLKCFNLHKGDKVKLTVAGRSYTRKVSKNYHEKNHMFKIRLKKKIKKNCPFKVAIKNKWGTRMCNLSESLIGGEWEYDAEKEE